jgi:hypothetical protein
MRVAGVRSLTRYPKFLTEFRGQEFRGQEFRGQEFRGQEFRGQTELALSSLEWTPNLRH